MPFAMGLLMALMKLTWLGAIVRAEAERLGATLLSRLACAITAILIAASVPSATPARLVLLNILYLVDGSRARRTRRLARHAGVLRQLADAFAFAPLAVFPGDPQTFWAAPADIEAAPTPALEELVVTRKAMLRSCARASPCTAPIASSCACRARSRRRAPSSTGWTPASPKSAAPDPRRSSLACQGAPATAPNALSFATAPAPGDLVLVGNIRRPMPAPRGHRRVRPRPRPSSSATAC